MKTIVRFSCLPMTLAMVLGCSQEPAPSPQDDSALAAEAEPTQAPDSKALESTAPEPIVLEPIVLEPIVLDPLPDPDTEEGVFSISQVMFLAHDNKLYRQLYSLPVDPIVTQRLLTLYRSLPDQAPPKGDLEDWNKRANALITAVETIATGDKAGIPAYKKAINCNSCHSRHRD